MKIYVVSILLIFCLALLGIVIERLYRLFAQKNPELGPFRQSGGGCGCCAAKEHCEKMEKKIG